MIQFSVYARPCVTQRTLSRADDRCTMGPNDFGRRRPAHRTGVTTSTANLLLAAFRKAEQKKTGRHFWRPAKKTSHPAGDNAVPQVGIYI